MATFGRYEILERIASGGMAEVYRARAWGAGDFAKDVVIKKILPAYSADPEFRSLFIQEARISVGLAHSRIVQVLDFGIMEGSYFIALELVDGPNLGELLHALRKAKAALPLPATLHVITEALTGLDYAHRRTGPDGKPMEIVHRDVSPSNVLLSFQGEVKISDFGIARAAGSPSLTRVGRVRGKPQYMSPEQIRGQPLDARSDLFSAGLLLYEMLTGFPAYGGFDDNAIMNAILAGDLAPPSSRSHDLPRTFDTLLKKALNLDEDQRYASAADLRQAVLDIAYLERLRPDPDVLAAVVKKHIPRGARSLEQSKVSEVLERSGADGDLERFTSTGSRVAVRTSTAESDRGPKAGTPAEPTTAESSRGPVHTPATLDPPPPPPPPPPPAKATRVLPPKAATSASEETNIAPPPSEPPADEASATQIRIPRSPAAGEPTAGLSLRPGLPPEETTGAAQPRPDPTGETMRRALVATDSPNPVPRRMVGLAVGLAVVAFGYLVVPLVSGPDPVRARATPAGIRTTPRTTGTLSLSSKPSGDVTVDGKSAGPTPIVDLVLPAGTHNVVITGAGGVSATFSVTIEPGKPTRKSVELK